MLYGILAFLIILLSAILCYELRGKNKVLPFSVSDKTQLIGLVKSLALNSKNYEYMGYGIDISEIKRTIRKSYKIISKKVKLKQEIFDFEKWLYENNYIFRKYTNSYNLSDFKNLPHIKNQPRIFQLARLITEGLNCNINASSVREIVDAYNEITVLNYSELCMLKKAIIISLICKGAEMAEKSIIYYKNKKAAKSGKIIRSKLSSQSYVYYLLKYNSRLKDKIESDSQINIENLDFEFTSNLVENCVIVKSIFNSINSIDNVFNCGIEKFSVIDKKLDSYKSYSEVDNLTKNFYLERISFLSRKLKVGEIYFTKKLLEFSQIRDADISKLLFKYDKQLGKFIKSGKNCRFENNSNLKTFIFIGLNLLISLTLAVVAGYFTFQTGIGIFVGLLSFIAFLKPIECLIIRFSGKGKSMPVPKMNYEKIPENAKTMVVVSELIGDVKSVQNAIEHLYKVRSVNKEENVYYALLCDLKPSSSEFNDEDKLILDKIRNLKLDDDIRIYVRKRVKCFNEFMGYERKRGAIMNLSDLLLNGNEDNFLYINQKTDDVKFFILLDSDNQLLAGSVKSAINTIIHPLNNEYDLLVFNSRFDLSSEKTFYSKRYYSESGFETYNSYSDYYYNRFGKSIYCGKCIVRIKEMYEKLNGMFPDNKILSHDIIEGAILNTGLLRDKVYEDAPTSFLSDMARKKRWERGDIQLLPYVQNKIKNQKGDKIDNVISPFYKYIIFSNTINVINMTAIFVLLCIFIFTLNYPILYSALAAFFIPYLISLIDGMAQIRSVRTGYVLINLVRIFAESLFKFFMLPYFALQGFLTFTVTIYRMTISKKNLLQWKTYKFYQGKNNFLKHFYMVLPSIIITSVIAASSLSMASGTYVFVFIINSILIYFAGMEIKDTTVLSDKDKLMLLEVAKRTYRLFNDEYEKNDNYLICDNFQSRPFKGSRKATSPTNIGFSLLSEISAYELNLVDDKVAIDKIKKIIDTVVKIDKWKGHLFNWYNTETLEALPPKFVSSVDSANFIASLICVKEFLKSKDETEYFNKVEEIIKNTDFKSLYNECTDLYYIGYNFDNDSYSGQYDLLASESRILSYIGSSHYGLIKNWSRLSRQCVSLKGNTLISWSGTAFEYFMPEIFLDTPKNSLLHNTMKNVLKLQSLKKCNGLFGIGESCYYKFDSEMNYQYRAFGLRALSLRSEFDKCIISPYSSVLALPFGGKKVLSNMRNLIECGAFSDYGFYESIDFTNGKNLVETYMSHHQGMILCSIANCLKNDCIKELFNSDYAISATKLILGEKQIITRFENNNKTEFVYENEPSVYVKSFNGIETFPRVNLLTNGMYSVIIDDSGCGYSCFDKKLLNVFKKNMFEDCGGYFYIRNIASKEIFSPTFAPLRKEDIKNYKCQFTDEEVSFENLKEKVKLQINVPPCFKGEVRKLSITNDTDEEKEYEIYFYTDLCLSNLDEQKSHLVFQKLFINTTLLEEKNAVIAEKSSLGNNGSIFCAIVVKGADNLDFETNRFNFIGRLKSEKCPDYIKTSKVNSTSFNDVLEPCFAFKAKVKVPKNSVKNLIVVLTGDNEKEKINRTIDEVLTSKFNDYAEEAIKMNSITESVRYLKSVRASELKVYLMSNLLYGTHTKEQLVCYDKNKKNLKSILGFDVSKYVIFDYGSEMDDEFLREILGVYTLISNSYIQFKLVISYTEENEYYQNVYKNILSVIEDSGCDIKDFVLINTRNLLPDDYKVFRNCAFVILCKEGNLIYPEGNNVIKNYIVSKNAKSVRGEISLPCAAGGFTENGYEIDSAPQLPFSNVISLRNGGSVVTENGGGFTFFSNSREGKVSIWHNDPVKDTPSEQVYLLEKNKVWRINKGYNEGKTVHLKGCTTFYNNVENIYSVLSKFHIFDGKVMIYEVELTNYGLEKRNLDLIFNIDLSLGWCENEFNYITAKGDIIQAKNIRSSEIIYGKTFNGEFLNNMYNLRSRFTGNETLFFDDDNLSEFSAFAAHYKFTLSKGQKSKFYFVISSDLNLIKNLSEKIIENEKNYVTQYFNDLNKFKISTENKYLDKFFNEWLMYQIVSSRFFGRCGYYQAGGAYGFRDQLQDMLSIIYSDTDIVRKHILLCAKMQFIEGDVMHWWHPPKFGVRTRISDDKLFLPYVAAKYIEVTGDYSILDENIEYLKSNELSEKEHSRLESPESSEYKEPLIKHLLKALDSSLKFGENNLLLIGSGDWNDGLDNVGIKNKGESVWLSMFCYEVINLLLPYIDCDKRIYYIECADKIKKAVEKCYDGDRFIRCITDDGEVLGKETSKVCKLDILTQCFSVFSNIVDIDKQKKSLRTAESLIDYENGLIKLLSPPFGKEKYYGYICSYPKGVRENGGQYTHAAVWYISALAKIGLREKAYELLNLILPPNKCDSPEKYNRYKGEPYVVAADVYSNEFNNGRMGWSWYTGSASWLYKTILEDIIGIKIIKKALIIEPKLPEQLGECFVEYRYKNAVYNIKIKKCGTSKTTIDKISVLHGYIPLVDKKKIFNVEYYF